ncbi:MAG: lamin tail domain-containing protein [bacterium]
MGVRLLIGLLGLSLLTAVWRPVLAENDLSSPSVIINELAWAGSSRADHGSSDEWIELKNVSTETVDVSGWELTKNTGTEQLMITLPAGANITAGEYFVISHFDATNSVLAVEPNMLSTALTLSNTKLQIKLYKGGWQSPDNLIDTAGDGGAPPAGNYSARSSMEREDDDLGWHDAMVSINLDSGVTDLATPMADNSVIVEPPTLISVSPNTAQTDSTLTIESVVGTNFNTDPTPVLQLKQGSNTITATGVQVVDAGLIDAAVFDLTDAAVGAWDLVLTNSDGKTAVLPAAITITSPPEQFDLATTVRINEVYPQPNTTANDEFVELYNFGSTTVNLKGWEVDDVLDGGSSPFELDGVSIAPKGFVVIYKPDSKITLNDDGDSVHLIQPNGFLLDSTTYEKSTRGYTWSRFNDGWKWTDAPTPNGTNVFHLPPPPPVPPEPEPDDPESTIPQPTFQPGDIVITELLPNPQGQDEFIELFNPTNRPIDLASWALADAANAKYRIKHFDISVQTGEQLIIQPQRYVIIAQSVSKIALNNSGGETVVLTDPAGSPIDQVSYPDKAPVGAAYALMSGEWTWVAQPTPGGPNIASLDETTGAVLGETDPAPIESLPPAGPDAHQWAGILLASLAGAGLSCWWEAAKHDKRNSHYYYRLARHLEVGQVDRPET